MYPAETDFSEREAMGDEFEYFSKIGRGGAGGGSTPSSPPTGSPPPSASSSKQRRAMSVRHRVPQNENRDPEEDALLRPRTNSMPSKQKKEEVGGGGMGVASSHNKLAVPSAAAAAAEADPADYLRVRRFQTSGKSIRNKGDSVKATRSTGSINGSASGASSTDEVHVVVHAPLTPKASGGSERSNGSDRTQTAYRVLILGGSGVGKTSLTQQFLTSDDVNEEEINDDGKEKFVSVLLDGEESVLIFMDSDYDKNNYDPSSANAYIVVYAVTDKASASEAKGLLKNLRHFEKDKAIILVGNKVDLARKRQVSTEDGQRLAATFDAEFIETSTMLNHKVDNLLVGILSQIKRQAAKAAEPAVVSKAKDFKKSIKGFLGKLISKTSPEKCTPTDV